MLQIEPPRQQAGFELLLEGRHAGVAGIAPDLSDRSQPQARHEPQRKLPLPLRRGELRDFAVVHVDRGGDRMGAALLEFALPRKFVAGVSAFDHRHAAFHAVGADDAAVHQT